MSGGHFEYKQFQLEEIASSIDELIRDNMLPDDYGYYRGYPRDILEKFREAAYNLRRVREMIHTIDYLVEGDYGEDFFKEAWDADVRLPYPTKYTEFGHTFYED